MATKKEKQPEKKAPAVKAEKKSAKKKAKAEKPAPAVPLPCKCGKRAVTLKAKSWMIYCVDAYCEKSRPICGDSEQDVIKKWNQEVAKK